jgi:hypothetical protein
MGPRFGARAAAIVVAAAALAGLTLVAAGCGGSSGAKVAQLGTTSGANGPSSASASSSAGPTAYSACMRSHGLANFPDPGNDGRINAAGIDKRSPAFQAAYRACRALDPGGQLNQQTRTQLQRQLPQLLAFAKCMRAHGVHTFPDPDIAPDGHDIEFANPGIDTNSPTFTAAAAACRSKLSRDQASRLFGKLFGGGKQPTPHGGK